MHPAHFATVRVSALGNINARKQAINDKLQRSVATYLRCVGVANKWIKKDLLLILEKNARDNHVLVGNFAKCLPIKKILADSAINLCYFAC